MKSISTEPAIAGLSRAESAQLLRLAELALAIYEVAAQLAELKVSLRDV